MAHLKNRLMFGGVNLSQYLEGIKIERAIMPDVNINTIDVPGRDGVILNGHTLRPLTITVTATLSAKKATDVATVRHALASLLVADKDAPLKALVLPDDPDITYDAMVSGSTTLSRGYGYPRVNIEFFVPSGYGYGALQTKSGGGTFHLEGNAPTWPTITITGASSSYVTVTRTDNTDTKFIRCKGASSIVIDTENETVTSNGNAVTFDLDSDFFELRPNNGTSVTVSGGSFVMTWRPRWV